MTKREHRPRAQRATIRDVAAKAAVSVTTVSHFVSGHNGACSSNTAERIRRAIDELRYVPNGLAQELGKRSTRTIGICLQNPLDNGDPDRGTFGFRVWSGIVRSANRHGYLLLQYPKSVDEGNSVDALVNGRADGIIIAIHPHDPRPALISEYGIPVVGIIQRTNIPNGIGVVYADERLTVDAAMTHLWDLGHRRIAHIAGPVEDFAAPEGYVTGPVDIAIWRRDAYVDWMARHGLSEHVRIVPGHSWSGSDVDTSMRALFQSPDRPTALFCANDELALKSIAAAAALGWDVPSRLSVVGVDNLDAAAASSPALTTVEVDAASIGEQAMELLLTIIDGQSPASPRIEVGGARLIERNSTATYRS